MEEGRRFSQSHVDTSDDATYTEHIRSANTLNTDQYVFPNSSSALLKQEPSDDSPLERFATQIWNPHFYSRYISGALLLIVLLQYYILMASNITDALNYTKIGIYIGYHNLFALNLYWAVVNSALTMASLSIFSFIFKQFCLSGFMIEIVVLMILIFLHYRHETHYRIEFYLRLETKRSAVAMFLTKQHELAEQAKSAFMANISHEINTPLNGVLGISQILLETGLSKEQEDYTKLIMSTTKRLSQLITNILDLTKIDSEQLRLNIEECSVSKIAYETVELASFSAHRKGLDLNVYIAHCPNVMCDGKRIKQVLSNILNNAMKFTESGSITVLMEKEGEDLASVTLKFSVSDTGIGISEKDLPILFHRFSQVDTSLSRKYNGSGLGLAISQQLIQLMGGKIQVQSEVKKGSLFHFTLSFDKPPNESINSRDFATLQPSSTFAKTAEEKQYYIDILYSILDNYYDSPPSEFNNTVTIENQVTYRVIGIAIVIDPSAEFSSLMYKYFEDFQVLKYYHFEDVSSFLECISDIEKTDAMMKSKSASLAISKNTYLSVSNNMNVSADDIVRSLSQELKEVANSNHFIPLLLFIDESVLNTHFNNLKSDTVLTANAGRKSRTFQVGKDASERFDEILNARLGWLLGSHIKFSYCVMRRKSPMVEADPPSTNTTKRGSVALAEVPVRLSTINDQEESTPVEILRRLPVRSQNNTHTYSIVPSLSFMNLNPRRRSSVMTSTGANSRRVSIQSENVSSATNKRTPVYVYKPLVRRTITKVICEILRRSLMDELQAASDEELQNLSDVVDISYNRVHRGHEEKPSSRSSIVSNDLGIPRSLRAGSFAATSVSSSVNGQAFPAISASNSDEHVGTLTATNTVSNIAEKVKEEVPQTNVTSLNTLNVVISPVNVVSEPVIVEEESSYSGKKSAMKKKDDFSLKGLRILVVEDNQINQLVVRTFLESGGAIVDYVNNGQEGYEKYIQSITDKKSIYDVILMDIQVRVFIIKMILDACYGWTYIH
jgi:signal transduction histidine kinase